MTQPFYIHHWHQPDILLNPQIPSYTSLKKNANKPCPGAIQLPFGQTQQRTAECHEQKRKLGFLHNFLLFIAACFIWIPEPRFQNTARA